jgi:hypothetical protein
MLHQNAASRVWRGVSGSRPQPHSRERGAVEKCFRRPSGSTCAQIVIHSSREKS